MAGVWKGGFLRDPVSGALVMQGYADRDMGRAGMLAPMFPGGLVTYQLSTNALRASRFVPSRQMTITKIALGVSVAAGSADLIDVGICDAAGNRLASSGLVQPTTGTDLTTTGVKVYTLAAPVTLQPNTPYYAAINSGAPITTAASIAAVSTGGVALLAALFATGAGNTDVDSIAQAPPIPAVIALTGNANAVAPLLAVREA